jgi:hypothetical protein
VNDIADSVVRTANRESRFLEFFLQGFYIVLVVGQEFHVVTTRKTQESVAVFVCKVSEKSNRLDAEQTRRCTPDGIDFVAGLGCVTEKAGSHGFMIFPLPVILLDYGMKKLLVIRRPNIGDSFANFSHFIFSFSFA